jgi:SnoaL-like domain
VIIEDLRRWIEAYERAWRTPGTAPLAELFADEATYTPGPYDPVLAGRERIAAFWDAEREGADEAFTLSWEPVAIDGSTGVARVEVRYGPPRPREYRDLWIVTLDADRRATAFEEWPFHPGQPLVDRRP